MSGRVIAAGAALTLLLGACQAQPRAVTQELAEVAPPALAPARAPARTPVEQAAPEVAAPARSGVWDWSVQPYLWAASIQGDAQLGQLPSSELDLSFSDVLENLDLAIMVGVEAGPAGANWALLLDLILLDSTSETSSAEVEIKQSMVELDFALGLDEDVAIEFIAGLRYWSMALDVDIQNGAQTGDAQREWVDPILGSRGSVELSERWRLHARGDIGGFGVGSDFSYQALIGCRYSWSPGGSVGFGYRHLSVDYDHDGFVFDAALSGPILGAKFSF